MITSLPDALLHPLNIGFLILHTALIVFNLTGWILPRTRRLHLICVIATLFSWFVMGATHGIGYCVCTDWHFQIRRHLELPLFGRNYIQLMMMVFFGVEISQWWSDLLTGAGLLLIVVATAIVWFRQLFPVRSTSAKPCPYEHS